MHHALAACRPDVHADSVVVGLLLIQQPTEMGKSKPTLTLLYGHHQEPLPAGYHRLNISSLPCFCATLFRLKRGRQAGTFQTPFFGTLIPPFTVDQGWAKTNEPFFIFSGQKGMGVYKFLRDASSKKEVRRGICEITCSASDSISGLMILLT